MNFIDELRGLDFSDVGTWPAIFHAIAVIAVFTAVFGGAVYLTVWKNQIPTLERHQETEVTLKKEFSRKQRKAANLDAYKEQLREIEESFGTMLRQLPGQTEIPSLLVDISQTGLQAGLEEELFQPSDEVQQDFYAEKPIKIRLKGTFHELGKFVSGVAELPRIVTLHDVKIGGDKGKDASNDLTLDVTAKTYRYLEDSELVGGRN
ncbi:MAG: type 4a pilus biogenesis protein PilO [Gammaproteobacteria bacterium]|nr:type 4a pilus biogenesis protein PilO [Gammaproteobacteria bacterium]